LIEKVSSNLIHQILINFWPIVLQYISPTRLLFTRESVKSGQKAPDSHIKLLEF